MLYIGSDHAGYLMKEAIKNYLTKNNVPFKDVGCNSTQSVNFVEYAITVGEKVRQDKENKGILVCGSGLGVCIAANKVKGIIAGLVDRKELAALAVSHDHINVLCLSGRYTSIGDNLNIVQTFLNTIPLHDYHEERIQYLLDYENKK